MNKRNIAIGVTVLLFLGVVLGAMLMTPWPAGAMSWTDSYEFGLTVFNDYGIATLIVGVILFVSLLGGVYIAQEENE
ncbi:MAG: NADH-quinone oxidoreductase subunit J [Euryarchaeota archaeon]|nr:NADH-quinone oxidoreductase subunit J [Euryarchaeota archaeon]